MTEIRDAVTEIRQRQRELDGTPAAPAQAAAPAPVSNAAPTLAGIAGLCTAVGLASTGARVTEIGRASRRERV